jgi:uncharacterized hydrophobic protein (TIGR00271 family)
MGWNSDADAKLTIDGRGKARATSMAKTSTLQSWLRMSAEAKPKVYTQVFNTAELLDVSYWLEIVFSAGIATLGLVLNSPAVVIGAMLISPLMGPIMATGLGLAAGDLYLALKAIFKLVLSIVVAVGLAALIVWVLPFHSATGEILSRTNPTLLDLGIALLSGLAGSVAVNRAGGGGDGVTTLPGVAIAVALMPPLCAMGFGMGAGWRGEIVNGAGLLFLTNLVAIVASAFVVFLMVGIKTPEVRQAMMSCRMAEPLAKKLEQGRFRNVLRNGGLLRWRVIVLSVMLAAVAFPLSKALKQVAQEAVARDVVLQVVGKLVPAKALVSQETQVGKSSIAIRLTSTVAIPEARVKAAEEEISKRSGRAVDLTVQSVASQSELTQLMEKINNAVAPVTVAAPPAAPETVTAMQQALLVRVQPVVVSAWPKEAPLVDVALAVSDAGLEVDVRYQGATELTPISVDLLTQTLRDKLNSQKVTLKAERVSGVEAKRLEEAEKTEAKP